MTTDTTDTTEFKVEHRHAFKHAQLPKKLAPENSVFGIYTKSIQCYNILFVHQAHIALHRRHSHKRCMAAWDMEGVQFKSLAHRCGSLGPRATLQLGCMWEAPLE